jgi:hypothetical protein
MWALLATPSCSMRGTAMQHLQQQTPAVLQTIPPETTHRFDVAFHVAARDSIESMDALRVAVKACVTSLKAANIGSVQMLLTMKECVKQSTKRYRPTGDEAPKSNVNMLTDYIVKWAIIEYYSTPA